jgi:hypothetical protein
MSLVGGFHAGSIWDVEIFRLVSRQLDTPVI